MTLRSTESSFGDKKASVPWIEVYSGQTRSDGHVKKKNTV